MTEDPRRRRDGSRSLAQLLADWRSAVVGTTHCQPPTYQGPDVQITHLTEKSGEVTPGAGFVARVRTNSDGHPFIGMAIEKGASLVLAQRASSELGITIPKDVVYLQVTDTAESLAWLAAAWEGFPSRRLIVIGITGTDGKTSTANILYEILKTAGLKPGLLSTVGAIIGKSEEALELHVTTPEAPMVQRYLRRMVDSGLSHCILESTSHGLAQHRVTAVDFDLAVITNITHEHFDYHGDYERYFAAKARLFELVAGDPLADARAVKAEVIKAAIFNRDDSSFSRLLPLVASEFVTYGIYGRADVTATDIELGADATRFTLHLGPRPETQKDNESVVRWPERMASVSSPLIGEFNVYNMLAAAAAADCLGVAVSGISRGLAAVTAVDGRMQRIERGQSFVTIVDFAHTPNALRMAIKTARQMTQARIITVIGSAGRRDVQKRRLMAEIAARDADLTVLTAEDPRTEPLEAILEAMAEGCRRQGGREAETFWRVPDRGRAIFLAVSLAGPGDLVLICGKGHEQSMCFGTTEYPWDDRTATSVALDALLSGKPMPDLGLPTYR